MSSLEMGSYPFNGDAQPIVDVEMEEKVQTAFGHVKVSIYGDNRNKPAILTFHDIGLDSENNFQNFFQFATVADLTSKFCIYNINAPGQEIEAKPLPENFVYPSMDGLAQIVANVVDHFGFSSFIGLGVGAGANVLLRYALNHQSKLTALILVNACITRAGWIEWGYEKVNIGYLQSRGMTSFTVDYLMWHHFGKRLDQCNPDIVRQYRAYFQNHPNPRNLALFIESFLSRTDITLHDPYSISPYLLKIPVLQLVGSRSAFIDETVTVNTKLDPAHTEWVKVTDSCGLVLDDKPDTVTEAVLLFLQGLGYFPTLNAHKVVRGAKTDSQGRICSDSKDGSYYCQVTEYDREASM
ncbi:ndr family domain-containing protein [Ditylenchus destructor]|uniref:Ndr family domain-containing protein n=1 Tax=Ditylenchus destructor TaxID=166010 RepID=A0AAD4QV74_9BILA|nr:ndr family domain-containing protein [Ditylenchus destructor]